MPNQSVVYLRDVETGERREAVLSDAIQEHHLVDFETVWADSLSSLLSQLPKEHREQSSHWNWRAKIVAIRGLLGNQSFAIECDGETQGLMIVDLLKTSRSLHAKNKPLVYVDYLEAAPWNRDSLTAPRFRGVGSVMLAAAIQLSRDEGFAGRIGLHSLPQSESWYAKRGMSDLGRDPSYQNLKYFEMDETQSSAFFRGGRSL